MTGPSESLDYFFEPKSFSGPDRSTSVDEADVPALIRLKERLDEYLKLYLTVDALTLDDRNFSIEQQLAVNKRLVAHLRELIMMVETAIQNAKEE